MDLSTFTHFLKIMVLRDAVYLYLKSNYSKRPNYQNSWGSQTNILKMTLRSDALKLVEKPVDFDADDCVNAYLSIKQGLNV